MDIITAGREPEREPRPPLPRRWRVAAWALLGVAGGLGLIGLSLRHGAAAPGAPAPSATARPTAGAGTAGPAVVVAPPTAAPPVPGRHLSIVVCAPSTGACSFRAQGRQVTVTLLPPR